MSGYSLEGFQSDPGYQVPGFQHAAGHSIIGYRERQKRSKRGLRYCLGGNDTCKAFRANGTEYCIGHLRSLEKQKGDAK
jgi:hypothetical protein